MVQWTSISVLSGFTLPSSTMTAMFENFQAISSGYAGAPKINNTAVETGTAGWQAMKTATGSISITNSGGGPSTLDITLPSHCFMPSFKSSPLALICLVNSSGFTASSADQPLLRVRGLSGVKPSIQVAYRYLID